MNIEAIAALSGDAASAQIATAVPHPASPQTTAAPADGGFAGLIENGLASVEHKINHANALVRAFATDDSIPVHEVTIALEEARLAVELTVQVRARLVEGYREIMNMQL